MIYIVGWSLIYIGLIAHLRKGLFGRFFPVFSIIFVGIVAVVRGEVGTDTANYEIWAANARSLEIFFSGKEPGFLAFIYALSSIFDSDQMVIRAISFSYVVMLLMYYRGSNYDERFVLLSFILPTFFFQYSMNVLRIGLASVFLLFAMRQLRDMRKIKFIALGGLAIAFHYSAMLSVLYLWAHNQRMLNLHNLFAMLIATVFFGVIIYSGFDNISDKSLRYIDHQSPSELSGLSQVIAMSIILLGLAFSRLPALLRYKLIGLNLGLMMMAWMVARQSYAGLRFLDLLEFILPLSLLIVYSRERLALDWPFKLSLVLAGVTAVAARYRGFLSSEGVGATPFLPYSII